MTKDIQERMAVEATVADAKKGVLEIGIITPGWGSSGYYSDKVLENAAEAKIFPAGTHMYFDHPTESDQYERPARSVLDLAAVLSEDATWDGTRLKGKAQVFGPYRELLTDEDFTKAIGVSIRAAAEVTTGEAEGQKGQIITALVEGKSVDFVTHAGRGGSILSVLESARPERVNARAVAHGVEESTADETREALTKVVQAAHGASGTWVWVRDFDDDTVWFSVSSETDNHLYQQVYSLDDNEQAVLAGDPTEVRAKTVYVPMAQTAQEGAPNVPAPAGRTKEIKMGSIQVDEAEHTRLSETAGRVPQLEKELAEAKSENTQLREERAAAQRTEAANSVIDRLAQEAGVTVGKLARRGMLADMPVVEGELDEPTFETAVKASLAEEAEALGAGRVSGFGRTQGRGDSSVVSESDFEAAMRGETQEG